jgi:hypothetical protein
MVQVYHSQAQVGLEQHYKVKIGPQNRQKQPKTANNIFSPAKHTEIKH